MVEIPLRLPCWGIHLLQLPDSFKIVYVSLDDVIYSVYLKPCIWQSGTNFYYYLRRATWPIVLLLQLGQRHLPLSVVRLSCRCAASPKASERYKPSAVSTLRSTQAKLLLWWAITARENRRLSRLSRAWGLRIAARSSWKVRQSRLPVPRSPVVWVLRPFTKTSRSVITWMSSQTSS